MPSIVSQKELDELLSDFNFDIQEEIEKFEFTNKDNKVLKNIKRLNNILAEKLERNFKKILFKNLEIDLYSIKESFYGEYLTNSPYNSYTNIITLNNKLISIILEPKLNNLLIDLLLGGNCNMINIDRNINNIDKNIIDKFIKNTLYKELINIFEIELCKKINFSSKGSFVNTNSLLMTDENEIVIIVKLKVKINNEISFISIAYKYDEYEKLLNENQKQEINKDILSNIKSNKIKIELSKGNIKMNINDIQKIKNGSILFFEKNEYMSIDNELIYNLIKINKNKYKVKG